MIWKRAVGNNRIMDVQLLKVVCRTLDWVVSIKKNVIKGSSATVEFMIFFLVFGSDH